MGRSYRPDRLSVFFRKIPVLCRKKQPVERIRRGYNRHKRIRVPHVGIEKFMSIRYKYLGIQKQHTWVTNGGFNCEYTERLWNEDAFEEERRLAAVEQIKKSIDNGVPAVSWDIGVPEWGLITGYDDETRRFSVLAVNREGEMPYDVLGKRELPLLSVLTVNGVSGKSQTDILNDTKKLAVAHLQGKEWCDNAKGLDAYPALIKHFESDFNPEVSWNMEYFLGTFGGLKYYAWKYLEKYGQNQLAEIYKSVYDAWLKSFQIKTSEDISQTKVREEIASLLKSAHKYEKLAVGMMSEQ